MAEALKASGHLVRCTRRGQILPGMAASHSQASVSLFADHELFSQMMLPHQLCWEGVDGPCPAPSALQEFHTRQLSWLWAVGKVPTRGENPHQRSQELSSDQLGPLGQEPLSKPWFPLL